MNKTPNYNLNQWEADDRVLRTDFNADNAKIDAALGALEAKADAKADASALETLATRAQLALKAELVFGTYTGNGAATRIISLGFRPRAVYVCRNDGVTMNSTHTSDWYYCGGLALDGHPIINPNTNEEILAICDTGFIVVYSKEMEFRPVSSNYSGSKYHYFAVK